MPDLSLDLRHLRDALLVVQHGSLRRAADAANISQSTLSRRIQLLERRLGVVLFERTRTGTRPTVAGEHFMRDAKFGAEHLSRAVGEMALVRQGRIGGLRIGLIASLAQGPLSDLLDAYRQRFPNVELRISEDTSQAHAAAMLSGRLDAAFLLGEPRLPTCETLHLYEEAVFAALPISNSLALRSRLTWEDLRHETLLVRADGSGPEVEAIIVRHLSSPGFRPKITVQYVGRENLLNMVGRGHGLTLVTSSAMGTIYPGVHFIPIAPAEIVRWSIVWSTNNSNPALNRLLKMSADIARSKMPSALNKIDADI